MRLLLAQDQDNPLHLDDFAELPGMKAIYTQMRAASYARVSPYAPVFQVLNEMARPEVALISKDLLYSARLRVGRTGNASQALKSVAAREHDLIHLLRDEEPNPEGWVPLALRRVNQALVSKGHKSLPHDVIRALRTLATDGRKVGRPAALFEVGYTARDHTPVRVTGSWTEILELSTLRTAAAAILVQHLISKAKAKAKAEVESTLALVEFSEAEAIETLRSDVTLNLSLVHDVPMFVQYLLVYFHDNRDGIGAPNGRAGGRRVSREGAISGLGVPCLGGLLE